jgi:methylated-DNA-[protein]-cysteine S-methyltransferase
MILSQHDDIAATTLETPVGELLLVATDHGISSITFPSHPFNDANKGYLDEHPEIMLDETREEPRQDFLSRASQEIDEYFHKERYFFDVGYDLGDPTDFRSKILDNLRKVPYGSRITYSELAASSGAPRAVRAVASVCATNMLPIMIPCHRIIRAGGMSGNYIAGEQVKQFLLDLEG